jgi:hypothetical protein
MSSRSARHENRYSCFNVYLRDDRGHHAQYSYLSRRPEIVRRNENNIPLQGYHLMQMLCVGKVGMVRKEDVESIYWR